jgi:hypothetical protein
MEILLSSSLIIRSLNILLLQASNDTIYLSYSYHFTLLAFQLLFTRYTSPFAVPTARKIKWPSVTARHFVPSSSTFCSYLYRKEGHIGPWSSFYNFFSLYIKKGISHISLRVLPSSVPFVIWRQVIQTNGIQESRNVFLCNALKICAENYKSENISISRFCWRK